ncbi:MAG: peptidase M48 [Alphaproteobacteria bacterium]|nr:peptidase M48 [Alphaproteobacteria bacterium]
MIPSRKLVRAALAALLVAGSAALQGCAVNPATGQQSFTGFMSPQDELKVGREQHPEILKQFGCAYSNAALAAYVQQVGLALARQSELPDLAFTFTVLNSPAVNAFALPGGYVYVTRGLLALAGDEAEMAGVLAHEIGHVIARHAAQRYSQSVIAAGVTPLLGVVVGDLAEIAQLGAAAYLQSYSRDQEFQSDELGVRYLTRAGYDPRAMASFLSKLLEDSKIAAEAAGRAGEADRFDLFATHPRTLDRVERALAEAKERPIANPRRGREEYLPRIDGMLYCDDPDHGLVRGRVFAHPEFRVRFEVPEGYRLANGARQVQAQGPDGALIVFDRAPRPSGARALDYLTGGWSQGLRLSDPEAITIDGLDAATAWSQVRSARGPRDMRLVAIRVDSTTIYRFTFLTAPQTTAAQAEGQRRTAYSFHRLGEVEAARLKGQRLRVQTARAGDTTERLSAGFGADAFRLRRFANVNDLPPGTVPQTGQPVKVIEE